MQSGPKFPTSRISISMLKSNGSCANYSKTDGRRIKKKNGVISFDNCKQYSTPIFHIPIIQKLCGYFVGAMQEGKELKCINEQKSLGPMGAVLCTIIML